MVNIDPNNPTARPAPNLLDGIPHVRFGWKMRDFGYGNFDAAFNHYAPYMNSLLNTGHKLIIVLTHETWGEGQGYDWNHMSPEIWQEFIARWVQMVGDNIVRRFVNNGIIWQIWNEPDSLEGTASVRMTAQTYGALFRSAKARFDQLDPSGKIITAGLNSGVPGAVNYVKAAGIQPDGIALHEYGRGAASNPDYRPFGTLEQSLSHYRSSYPNTPLYLTEFGVLDQPNEPVVKVSAYARDFIRVGKQYGAVSLNYFAWGIQHNGYPVVNPDGSVKTSLQEAIRYAPTNIPPEKPTEPPLTDESGKPLTAYTFSSTMNARATPNGAILFSVNAGERVYCYESSNEYAGGYTWKKCNARGQTVWIAIVENVRRTLVR